LMDSDLAWVNGKSGRQSWRYYADAFQRSIISEAIYHLPFYFACLLILAYRCGFKIVGLKTAVWSSWTRLEHDVSSSEDLIIDFVLWFCRLCLTNCFTTTSTSPLVHHRRSHISLVIYYVDCQSFPSLYHRNVIKIHFWPPLSCTQCRP